MLQAGLAGQAVTDAERWVRLSADPVEVRVNGCELLNERISQSADTLLEWAARDLDRSMLFTAELKLEVPRQPCVAP